MPGVPAAFLAFMSAIGALVGFDLTANPMSPPQIFAAQFTEAFGHPPGLPARPVRPVRKRVFVTRP